MLARRGRSRGSARVRVLLGLALSGGLLACSDDAAVDEPESRRVIRPGHGPFRTVSSLWDTGQDAQRSGVAPRLDEHFDAQALPAGEVLTRTLELAEGRRYTVRVDHDGPAPELRAGPARDERGARLPPIPGPPRPGITQALLRPGDVDGAHRLELHGADGLVLRRVVVRPWGNAGHGSGDDQGPPWSERVSVGAESRTGGRLAAGRHAWTVTLPGHASHLDLAVANPTPADGSDPRPAARLVVSVTGQDGHGPEASLEVRPADHGGAWEPVRLALGEHAGGPAEVSLQVLADDTTADALLVSNPLFANERGRRERKNLVIVSIDTLRPDHLGHLGYERDTSPRLDALAAESVVFEQAMSTAPFTLPSHASMFSGQYPSTHGAEHPAHAVADDVPWLPSVLAELGWATRAFTGGGYLHPDYGFARGFHEYSFLEPVFELPEGDPPATAPWPIQAALATRRAVHWDAALEWIERHRELPFLLVLHTFAVHDYRPHAAQADLFHTPGAAERVQPLRRIETQVEQPYSEAERLALTDLYDEALRSVDGHMGDLLDTLARLGLDEHTVLVVTSDHGEILGEHALRGAPLVGHSWSLYDALVRVPLMIRAPQLEPRRIRERVSSVDLAPTLLALLGEPAPAAMQGTPLTSWLRGDRSAVRPSPPLAEIHSHYGHEEALVAGPHKVVLGDPDAPVQFPSEHALQLFDLRADPSERRSVHAEQPDAAEALAETLRRLRDQLRAARAGDPADADLGDATLAQLRALGYLDG